MSYSITFTVRTKAEAKQRVVDEMSRVVAGEPRYAPSQDAAIACAHAFIDLLEETPSLDVRVTMHGEVIAEERAVRRGDALARQVSSVGAGALAYLVNPRVEGRRRP
jgi:hypothetical protein